MTQQVALAIDVSDERATVLPAMARRSRAVHVVDDIAESTALITNQVDVALTAVANGNRVMVLDPFAISSQHRGTLASSQLAAPALPSRFQPSIWQVKQALDAGKLGAAGLLRIHHWQASSVSASDLLESELDLAVWLMGHRPQEVYSCQQLRYRQVHLGFSGGSMALIDVDTNVPEGNSYYSLSLLGSTGAAYADDHRNMNLVFGDSGPSALPTSQRDVALAHMIDAFAQQIVTGEGFHCDWQQIMTVLEVTEQVRAAAKSGQVIAGGNGG